MERMLFSNATSAVPALVIPEQSLWPGLTRVLLMGIALIAGARTFAQDPQLSQFYAAPLYLNPALTGNTFEDRIILNYRKQWPGTGPGYTTYALGYDHNYAKAHSGLGGFVIRDVAGTSSLAFTQAALSYSYEAHINRRHAVRCGLRMGYTMREYDASSLIFADQIVRDNAPTSVEGLPIQRTSYFDASFGTMYFTEKFWFGASFSHINTPQQSLYADGDAKLPVRTSLHTGYRFRIDGQKVGKSHSRMTLAAHYKAQQDWDQLDLGFYINYMRLTGGLWYRGLPGFKAYQPGYPNDESIITMIGVETQQQLKIVYSYDLTISQLSMKSGGAHEISLIYEWPKRGRNKKYRAVPCPKF